LDYTKTDSYREEKGLLKLEADIQELTAELQERLNNPPSRAKLTEIEQKKCDLNFDSKSYASLKTEIGNLERDGWESIQGKINATELLIDEYRESSKSKGTTLETARAEYLQESKILNEKLIARKRDLDAIPEIEDLFTLEAERKSLKDEIESLKNSIVIAETSIQTKTDQKRQLTETIENEKLNMKNSVKDIEKDITANEIEEKNNLALLDPDIETKIQEVNGTLETIKAEIAGWTEMIAQLQRRIGSYESEIKQCEAAKEQADKKKLSINSDVIKLTDWRLIQKACSKDGIPALELDASGGQISNIANDLLTSTFDTAFQIRFETMAEKQDGGTKEVFDIKVLKDGEERDIEVLSGGQKVWIEKGIFESIAIYLSRSSDKQYLTSFSDESDGALSPAKKLLYLKMMRESFKLGGRHFTVLVSQDSAVWSQVQQRILFSKENGIEYQY
jgi:exonuclease SbcC